MPARPNILIINTDQQRYDSLGFTGHPVVRTPHLDQLAARGMQFQSAYTPFPVCCPARQTLLSGVMPEQHHGLWNYDRSGGSLPVSSLSPERSLWVRQLREAGYRTAYLGKWHVHPTIDPTGFGFEVYRDPQVQDPQPSPRTIKYPVKTNPWFEFPIGASEALPVELSNTHKLAAACVAQIEAFGEEPWHIRLDFPEPHLPCVPVEPFASMFPPETISPWGNFAETFRGKPYIQQQQLKNWGIENWTWEEWSIYLSGYFGVIAQVDDAIGRVMAKLEDSGKLADTLIIYTSDHGDAAGSHRMMDKHYVLYEEEVHVPLVIRWDGVIPAGTVCDDHVSHYLDLPVTLLEMLGLPVPPEYQGRSFYPQLLGRPARQPREFAFSSYNGQQFGLYCQRMIRDRRYKYIWNATDIDECYDLIADPFELNNLAAIDEDSELCRSYRRKVFEVFSELNDPLVTGPWMSRWLKGD